MKIYNNEEENRVYLHYTVTYHSGPNYLIKTSFLQLLYNFAHKTYRAKRDVL